MGETIDKRSLAILTFKLVWQSESARHTEVHYVPLNVWREADLLPPPLGQVLWGQELGTRFRQVYPPGAGCSRFMTVIILKCDMLIPFMGSGEKKRLDSL